MKPLGKKNYGSIPHLSNSKLGPGDHFITEGQERILTQKKRDRHDEVFVFEKYDGSNVGVAMKDGEVIAITRSGYLANTSPYKQHHLFSDWVWEYEDIFYGFLDEGERICGEWMAQAHGLKYKINTYPIVFFDWFDKDNNRKPFDELIELNVPLPRLLHRGDSINPDELKTELNKRTPIIYSEENPEGMVYRVERNSKVDFLAKWVRNDFEPGKYMIDKEENELTWNI